MSGSSRSLLDFLDAPIVVGDPDGRAVYVNPAFESCFAVSRETAKGEPLASLFEGGGREAMLNAVAGVYRGQSSVRFRLREGGVGYAALASPIVVEEGRVGVIILLTEELPIEERLLAFHRDVQEPMDELTRCLSDLILGPAASAAEDGIRALERIRKRMEELQSLMVGKMHGGAAGPG